jgi:Tol biopolymer transport system component
LFLVSKTGEIKRLTYFSTTDESWQEFYSWSLDGQRIAFLLQSGGYAGTTSGELSVVDVKTKEVTNYCINGSFIWANDGQYIVVTQTDEKIQNHVLLIDLQSATAWKIADEAMAIDWMVTP